MANVTESGETGAMARPLSSFARRDDTVPNAVVTEDADRNVEDSAGAYVTAPVPTRRRRFSEDVKASAVASVAAGATVREVAESFDVTAPTVHYWIRTAGRTRKVAPKRSSYPSSSGNRKASPKKKEAVLDDLSAGVPWKEIGRRHEVVPSTIYRWAKRSGRFLYGELAPRVGDDDVPPAEDMWWTKIVGVDERTATIAVAALKAGVTRARLVELTGWTPSRAETFVRHGRARRGLPGFVSAKAAIQPRAPHVEDTIDWSRPPTSTLDFDVEVAVAAVVPSRQRTRPNAVRKAALARLDAGESRRDVAADIDLDPSTLRTWEVDRANGRDVDGPDVHVSKRKRAVPRLSEESMVAAVREFVSGSTYAEIATRHGVEAETVRVHVLAARNRARRSARTPDAVGARRGLPPGSDVSTTASTEPDTGL